MSALPGVPGAIGDQAPESIESIGGFLIRARMARGWSQLRMAELLCAVSGSPTVTRHEVSRWERGERIPSGFWLGWLAAALETPVPVLELAAASARQERAVRQERELRQHRDRPTRPPAGPLTLDVAALAARVAVLRTMDDLMGGADLAWIVLRELRAVSYASPSPAARPMAAELAQVTASVLADAGSRSALWAARIGFRFAVAAHDRPLTAHLLGGLSESAAESGDCGRAVRLAAAATQRATTGPRVCQALQLHRLAYAAARAGHHQTATDALRTAGRLAAGRADETAPAWLSWLDEPRFTALTGRCYAALGRARPAKALLTEALGSGKLPPRARAVFGAWLGLARAESGDLDGACEVAGFAILAAICSGSVVASRRVRALDAVLRRCPTASAVARYAAFADQACHYLPDALAMPQFPVSEPSRPRPSQPQVSPCGRHRPGAPPSGGPDQIASVS